VRTPVATAHSATSTDTTVSAMNPLSLSRIIMKRSSATDNATISKGIYGSDHATQRGPTALSGRGNSDSSPGSGRRTEPMSFDFRGEASRTSNTHWEWNDTVKVLLLSDA